MIEARGGRRRSSASVASVIYNRLHEGMPLGIDATIRFATGNYTKPLTESELDTDSPYNTRTNTGLPPGPINSPGLAAIEAAAHPAKTKYLFYVNKPNSVQRTLLRQDRSRIQKRRPTLQQGARGERRQLAEHLRMSAARRALAVIGHPVAHSRSPAMQNAALAALGLGEEWSYEAIDVAPEDFEARVARDAGRRVRRRQRHRPPQGRGAGLADELSEVAREIGAANTLTFRATASIAADEHRRRRAARRAARLARHGRAGSGARRRRRRPGVVWALVRGGAEVEVWNRTALELGEPLRRARAATRSPSPTPAATDLIVNTTAVGLRGEDPFEQLPLSADAFTAGQVVVDMVYGERSPRALLAGRRGGRRGDGRRARGPGPAGRALAADLDRPRAAARGDAAAARG